MPLIESYMHGTPCWVDLATSDLEGAREFYSGLFGWRYEDEQMGQMGIGTYSMAMVDDVATAAIYELGSNQLRLVDKPAWHVYVSVDNIEDVVAESRSRGGGVIGEAVDIDRAGRVAAIADPLGVETTLWQPGEFSGSGVRAEPGALTWVEHVSVDCERSARFYEEVLGIDLMTAPMGSLDAYRTWMVNDTAVGGMFQWPDEMIADGVPSMWFVYFQVEDLDGSIEYMESNGGKAMADSAVVTDMGRILVLRDPQGADFCLVEPVAGNG